jgi:hypothetical protein
MAGRGNARDPHVFCIADLIEHSEKRLSKMASQYIAGGAMDMITRVLSSCLILPVAVDGTSYAA